MRRLIPLVLLGVMAYAGWFYWREYTDAPLRERLLLATAESVSEVTITASEGGTPPFQLTRRGEDQWVVSRDTRQLLDQSARAEAFVRSLTALRTDSVARELPEGNFTTITLQSRTSGEERIALYAAGGGPAVVRIAGTGDVFALQPEALTEVLPGLSFDYFRGQRLLRLPPQSVDSIVAAHHDSLLWRASGPAAKELAATIIAPASAPTTAMESDPDGTKSNPGNGRPFFADYFDEIADRDKYFATLSCFADGEAHLIRVYRDSLWPKPYVLVGEDFPRRYLGAATIGDGR